MKKTLFVLSFTLATLLGFSQHVLPDYVMVDVDSDTLRVRWEPSSLDEWFHSIDNGYDITISRKFDSGYQVVKSENIKLLDRASHIATANGQSDFLSQFYRSSVNLMYADKDPESGMSHLMKSIRKKSESTIDSFKINMLSYFSIFDIDLARHNGLGYVYKIDQGGDYKIEVSTGSYPASSIEFNTNDTSTIPDVALSAKFGSKNVKLTWDTKELVGKYFGFYLEKSENGINYEKTTDLPYVMPKKRENLEYRGQISAIDSFPVNYEDKFYGIRVVDYFGNVSALQSVVTGYGFDEIKYSPLMQSGDQLPTNQAELHWSIVSEDLPLIQHFRVMRADSAKGLYTIAKDSIPKSHRITKVDMEYTTNYFRVESVPVDGDPLSSTPVFVMGIDSIPPLTPEVISATIDSSGQVVLTWQANSEPDLWGYRVFRSNYDDKEYSLVSQGVMQDTVFIDTTHMTLGVENVYYQLHAADTRNNRSPFTEPIVIVKPDIVPPATPTIISFDTSPDTVKINWSASVSDDAVYHKIFKRAIRTENAWTLIEILDTLTAVSPYIDIAVEPGVRYAYTMQAVDEGGLESGPAAMKAVTVPVPKENFESINHFTAEVNKNDKTIELEWDVNDIGDVETYLLYKGSSIDKVSRYKYLEADLTEYVEEISEGQEAAYYKIRPIYASRDGNYFSDTVEVDTTDLINADEPKERKSRKERSGK